jgi:hypothetical protein
MHGAFDKSADFVAVPTSHCARKALCPDMYPALITGAITIVGWYVTYAYTKSREDRTRRLDIALKLKARQIEELYGPLLSLIEQIFTVWQVRQNILAGDRHTGDDQRRVREFFWKLYFSPLHEEIGALLRAKLYLLEGGHVPTSFEEYLEHSTQEACQHRIWAELAVDTSAVQGRKWPADFHEDVKGAFNRLMAEYQAGVTRLGSTAPGQVQRARIEQNA